MWCVVVIVQVAQGERTISQLEQSLRMTQSEVWFNVF